MLAFKKYCLQENQLLWLTIIPMLSFDFTVFVKVPRKFVKNIYDYAKGDFEGWSEPILAMPQRFGHPKQMNFFTSLREHKGVLLNT